MRVLAVHVVREDDHLQDVRMYRFAEMNNFVVSFIVEEGREGGNAQPLAIVAWLCRDVERDPPVGAVERDRAHFL